MSNLKKLLCLSLLCLTSIQAIPSVRYLSTVCVPNEKIADEVEKNVNCMIQASYVSLYGEEAALGLEPLPSEHSSSTLKSMGSESITKLTPAIFTSDGIAPMKKIDPSFNDLKQYAPNQQPTSDRNQYPF